jgi:hypothetical protein
MYNKIAMQVPHTTSYLPEVVASLILRKVGLLANLSEEAAIGCEFKEQVDLLLITEETVHDQHIGVMAIHLNLDLLHELGLQVRLFQLLLVDHLDGQHKTGFELPGHVHIAKTTLP